MRGNLSTPYTAPGPRRRSRARTLSKSSTAQGPWLVHTTLVSTPKKPSAFSPCGATSRCESKCSRRSASEASAALSSSEPITVPTATVSVSRSSSRPASAANSSGTSATDNRVVPLWPESISSGAGNQVSRIDPLPASVASPIPEAAVTRPTLPTYYAETVLDLRGDPIELTAALVDIPSESRHEERIADEVEAALRAQTSSFEIIRNGNAVLARTALGRPTRVLLAGHLDTVPVADNLPSRRDAESLHGCGTTDMKSGDAVFLHLAATVTAPAHDLTLVFYDCEEIESSCRPTGLAPTRRDHGWATTPFTSWAQCWIGSPPTRPAVLRSTAAPIA